MCAVRFSTAHIALICPLYVAESLLMRVRRWSIRGACGSFNPTTFVPLLLFLLASMCLYIRLRVFVRVCIFQRRHPLQHRQQHHQATTSALAIRPSSWGVIFCHVCDYVYVCSCGRGQLVLLLLILLLLLFLLLHFHEHTFQIFGFNLGVCVQKEWQGEEQRRVHGIRFRSRHTSSISM